MCTSMFEIIKKKKKQTIGNYKKKINFDIRMYIDD